MVGRYAPTAADGDTADGLALLDHVYAAVVGAATADAIEHSGFLPRLSQFDVEVVQSGDQSWRGRYLRGRRTRPPL